MSESKDRPFDPTIIECLNKIPNLLYCIKSMDCTRSTPYPDIEKIRGEKVVIICELFMHE